MILKTLKLGMILRATAAATEAREDECCAIITL
jgi:hypothetical protein